MHWFAKSAYVYSYRGLESLTLLQIKPSTGLMNYDSSLLTGKASDYMKLEVQEFYPMGLDE